MVFTDEQKERYARHIILDEVGIAGQEKLFDASVLIIGAGGLSGIALFGCRGCRNHRDC